MISMENLFLKLRRIQKSKRIIDYLNSLLEKIQRNKKKKKNQPNQNKVKQK